MEPRRIFFLASDLTPSGSTRQLALVAGGLARVACPPSLGRPANESEPFRVEVGVLDSVESPLAEELRAVGIPMHSVPIRHAIDFQWFRKLRKVVAAANPSIIHAWGPAAVRASRLVAKKRGDGGNAPRIIASAASFPLGGISGWLATRQLRRCDRVVPTTWAEGERYRRLGVLADRLTRIAPGVAPPPTPPDRAVFLQELGLPANAKIIAVAGRLEPASGFKSAVWAFDMLRYEHPDWHLVIFGEGPEREALEAFGRAVMFDDFRIHFAGFCPDLPALLAHADLVWMTHERGGIALALEAMAAGKPVFARKSSEMAELVEDGQTGFLIDAGERSHLSAKSYPFLTDAAARAKLGEAGRLRAVEHFSAARAVEQFARLYEEVAR